MGEQARRVRLNLFGQPSLLAEGRTEPLPARERALSLLAYLALHPGPQQRERVAFTLLPDEEEAAALASLRRQLLFIKKIVPIDDGRWLKAGFRTIAWDEDAPVECDLRLFERWCEREDEDAAELYTGDLLPQLSDEWLGPHRRRLRERQTALLVTLAARAVSHRQFERAMALGRRALELDPWREDALRTVMIARAAGGDRSGAVDEFMRYEEMLKLELGVVPMRETIALSESLARNDLKIEQQANVPVVLATMVGRESELAAIRGLLKEARLVTLTGVGGIGKTSLGLLCARVLEPRMDRTVFIDLSTVEAGAPLSSAVLRAMNVRAAGQGDDAVAAAFGTHRSLLVLDTCEHIRADVSALVDALLRACPNLTILATSREPLGAASEFVYHVPPLDLPPESTTLASEAGRYAAVALFCNRARAADASFSLHDANAQAISELCRRLDGIPLAIELAASRAALFTPSQMLARLDKRLRLLGGKRRTMQEAIEWSYALLSPEEQRVFRSLGIFDAQFSVDAAGATGGDEGVDTWDVFGSLESLVAKSLVVATESGDERRFHLLETIWLFAREKLEAAGELDAVAHRMIAHFLEFARELRAQREAQTARDKIGRAMAREYANLRTAINLSLRERRDVRAGAEIVSLTVSHMRRHSMPDARSWCDLALEALPDIDPAVAARLMINRTTVTPYGPQRTELALAALEATRAAGSPRDIADALHQVHMSWLKAGDLVRSEAAAREALALRREGGTAPEIALALDNLSGPLFNAGRLEEARQCLEEAQRLDSNTISLRLMHLAELSFAMGDLSEALRYGHEVIPAVRAFEDRLNLALALTNLAAYEIRADRQGAARELLREAISVAREEGIEAHLAIAVQYASVLASYDGSFETGAHLFGWADLYFREHELGRETTEQWMYDLAVRLLRERFEPLELETLLDVGRRFSTAHAAREAERIVNRGRLVSAGSA